MKSENITNIRILVNLKSGLMWSFDALRRAVSKCWDIDGRKVTYQFCKSRQDGIAKAVEAVKDGVELLFAAGGDGTVSSIGGVLVGTETTLGVIPSGSGNGFARHFEIPLGVDKAIEALSQGVIRRIDVGTVDGKPFLVTCSMAWDASIVRSFEKSLFRGILPYIFAGVNEYFLYKPQPVRVSFDGRAKVEYADPIVFTAANLSQFGGGAVIAPDARSDDGRLEAIIALSRDVPQLLVNFPRLYDGSVNKIKELKTARFKKLVIERDHNADIQVDGELVPAGEVITIEVKPMALKVLVPPECEAR